MGSERMADDRRKPAPAPRFLTAAVALPRIQAIVTNASAIWFSQIGYLAFITVTLLSVRDLDFFSVTSRISLPLLAVTIPTETFFYIAPWLAAVLHVYFHLFLLKLWDAVAEAPPSVGTLPLGERVAPWLVVDWALRRRSDYAKATTHRPMTLLGSAVTGFLIWLATPLIIVAFWWRSMPAHDARLTLAIGAALLVSLYASLLGWRRARRILQLTGIDHDRKARRRPGILPRFDRAARGVGVLALWLLMLGTVPLVAGASLAGAGWHHLPKWVSVNADAFWRNHASRAWASITKRVKVDLLTLYRDEPPLVVASLIGAEIAQRPADWRDWDVARRRFHVTWCRDQGLPSQACDKPEDPNQQNARRDWCAAAGLVEQVDCDRRFASIDGAFEEEWRRERAAYRANITRPDLRGRDLRGARAADAFLVGVDLREARIEGTDLSGARLEGAILVEAQLGWADLTRALLEATDLRSAQLKGATLEAARLERADLRGAQLEDVYLEDAWLHGADLRGAQLKGRYLSGAQLHGANLEAAELEGANLKGTNLEAATLKSANLEGADLSEAQLEGANLTKAQLEGANLTRTRLEGATLREAHLEGATLMWARLEGADLSKARLDGANLQAAHLEKAHLTEAWLEKAWLVGAQLQGASLAESHLKGAILNGANLTGALLERADLTGASFNNADLKGAVLTDAGLEGAYLRGAHLEGANLSEARLNGAILVEAKLDQAWLRAAMLEAANLTRAHLGGADLRYARLKGANLTEGRLDGADLRDAQLQAADWTGATFAASPVHAADFAAGQNLTQSQLAHVIGDIYTTLPLDAETGEQLYVWTCWPEPPPNLDLLLQRSSDYEHPDLRARWLCPPGVAAQRTGRPADPLPAAPLAD